jgi:Domain of unknown function (DUF4404)
VPVPNEPNESLQQSLARLHAELAAAPRIDPASRQQLRELLADIQRTLASTQEDAEGGAVQAGGSIPRLEALAIEFETEHPGLSGSLRQLVDLLGRAGL